MDLPPDVLDESEWPDPGPESAIEIATALPLGTRFRLGAEITPIQHAFLDRHGYLVYDRVAEPTEVEGILAEVDRVQAHLLSEGTEQIFGVPVWMGLDPDGSPLLQRLAFTSVFSELIHEFVRDPRFEPVRQLVGADARVGDREKDGVVLNRYLTSPGSLRPGVGWHTDGLRDVFYNWRLPDPQLNVGLHLHRVRPQDGGLRILAGTHKQGVWSTLFKKPYFVSHRPDPKEIAVETWPGDLTVHDGRTWHRVAPNPVEGWPSQRVSMYVPYVTDAFQPKDASTKPMLYHRLFDAAMRAKRRRSAKQLGVDLP